MKLSIVIPAHNEEGCIAETLLALTRELAGAGQEDYEVVVVNDHCQDGTEAIVQALARENPRLRCVRNEQPGGFGMAVRCGLDHYQGDAVAIFMADASDSPADLVRYLREIEAGAECVFGSRFIKGGKVVDYPLHKLWINRLANGFIRLLFLHGLNDTTNAFKCYRREVIEHCRPFLSRHFNFTVELPLKAVVRGFRYRVIPISWHNRKTGVSKLKIKEMGSRYLFIVLYCFLERLLSRGDYYRHGATLPGPAGTGQGGNPCHGG